MTKYSMEFFVKRHGLFDFRVHVMDKSTGWAGYLSTRYLAQICALRACDDLTQWYRTGFDQGASK